MWNVYSLSLVIVILAVMWQMTEGGCGGGGGPKPCTLNSDCPPHYACLPGPKSQDLYCRLCLCYLKDQCYVNNEGAVVCNCSTTNYWGSTCNCPPCLGTCPTQFSQFKRNCHCFKAFTRKLTWENAKLFCENSNTNLVMITSIEENEYVRNLLPSTEYYWIGGVKSGGIWIWSVSNADIIFTNWAPSEPDNSGVCLAIRKSDGKWVDAACYIQRPFVCEYLYI